LTAPEEELGELEPEEGSAAGLLTGACAAGAGLEEPVGATCTTPAGFEVAVGVAIGATGAALEVEVLVGAGTGATGAAATLVDEEVTIGAGAGAGAGKGDTKELGDRVGAETGASPKMVTMSMTVTTTMSVTVTWSRLMAGAQATRPAKAEARMRLYFILAGFWKRSL